MTLQRLQHIATKISELTAAVAGKVERLGGIEWNMASLPTLVDVDRDLGLALRHLEIDCADLERHEAEHGAGDASKQLRAMIEATRALCRRQREPIAAAIARLS